MITNGDAYGVHCPYCSYNIELWEQVGELSQGDEIDCPMCNKTLIIHQIQHVVEISLTEGE